VVVADGKIVTITLDFELPAGWNKEEFEKNLQVLYYDEDEGRWKSDGIDNDNLIVEWDSGTSGTVTFNTTHLTKFAATSKSTTSSSSDGTQATSTGCAIDAKSHDISLGSVIANMLILSLPFIILGIRRKYLIVKNN
jgi:hypothetical protein